MQVSAVWRFMPSPPARVVIRKMKMFEFGELNAWYNTEIRSLIDCVVDPRGLRLLMDRVALRSGLNMHS